MKNLWNGTQRLSTSSSCRDSLYSKIEDGEKPRGTSFVTLNLDFELENPDAKKRADSPRILSLASGFETQDTVGGYADANTSITKSEKANAAIKKTEAVDNSDDEDPFVVTEAKILMKI